VGTVLLAISLFWLGLAEFLSGRGRAANLTLGIGLYVLGLLFFLIVEIVSIVGRGGVL
jgi:TM2 domain-containing membrane protein YozV